MYRRYDGDRMQVRYNTTPLTVSGTNAVRYGTAKGEWFLNAVSFAWDESQSRLSCYLMEM